MNRPGPGVLALLVLMILATVILTIAPIRQGVPTEPQKPSLPADVSRADDTAQSVATGEAKLPPAIESSNRTEAPPGQETTKRTSPTSTPPGTPGGLSGGLVVRGARLVQPWIGVEYQSIGEYYQIVIRISLEKTLVLAPMGPGDVGSQEARYEHPLEAPLLWSPLGFWDAERMVLYVLEDPAWYAVALLTGRVDEANRMFRAVVPPGDTIVEEARLLPPHGPEGGLLVLTGKGSLVYLSPPRGESGRVVTGKSGIVEVLFPPEAVLLSPGPWDGVSVLVPESEGTWRLGLWRGETVALGLLEARGEGARFVEEARLELGSPVRWVHPLEGGTFIASLVASTLIITPEGEIEKVAGPLGGMASVSLSPVGGGALVLGADGGVYLLERGGGGGFYSRPLPLPGERVGFDALSYNPPYLALLGGRVIEVYELLLEEGSVTGPIARVPLKMVPEKPWLGVALGFSEEVAQEASRVHGLGDVAGFVVTGVLVGSSGAVVFAQVALGD